MKNELEFEAFEMVTRKRPLGKVKAASFDAAMLAAQSLSPASPHIRIELTDTWKKRE